MIRFFIFLLPFIREMIFGKKEEQRGDSFTTKARKTMIYCIIVSSLFINFVAIKKLYTVSVSHVNIRRELSALKDVKDTLDKEIIRREQLEISLNNCIFLTGRGEQSKKYETQ